MCSRAALLTLVLSVQALQAQTPAPFSIDTIFSSSSAQNVAGLQSVCGAVVDPSGNVYISDCKAQRVYRQSPSGALTVIAGTGQTGFSGDSGPAIDATFNQPGELGLDGAGNLFIVDVYNQRVRRLTPSGIITTVAGNGSPDSRYPQDGGAGIDIAIPRGDSVHIAVDTAGNLFLTAYSRIFRVSPTGVVKIITGQAFSPYLGDPVASAGRLAVDAAGDLFIASLQGYFVITPDGIGFEISITAGMEVGGGGGALNDAIAFDASRGFCASSGGYQIWCLSLSGRWSRIAGNGKFGNTGDGGSAVSATFGRIALLTFDSAGNLLFIDGENNVLRKITPANIISTVAKGTNSISVDNPRMVAVDPSGNVYISDTQAKVVWRRTPSGAVSIFAGNGALGRGGENVPATDSPLISPWGVASDSSGNIYIADIDDNRVRVVDTSGMIRTLAGTGASGFAGDGGLAVKAQLNKPWGVAVDSYGNVYIADTYNNRIRRVSPDGVIRTVAGTGPLNGFQSAGMSGDGGLAAAAQLDNPRSVAVSPSGEVYITERNFIRRFYSGGTINTAAGTGACQPDGDGMLASQASVCPGSLAFDFSGNLYVTENSRLRRIDTSGVISTIAGTGAVGASGDGGPAVAAQFDVAWGIATDSAGNMYVVDAGSGVLDRGSKNVRRIAAGARCSVRLSSSHLVLDGAAANGSFSITPLAGCQYTASTNDSWIHIDAGGQGSSPASLTYHVDTNLGSTSRSGMISIDYAGSRASFYVYQSGARCQLTLNPASLMQVEVFESEATVQLIQNPANCAAFEASSDSRWVTITSPPAFANTGYLTFAYANNPTTGTRSAKLNIGGRVLTIVQAAAPVQVVDPPPGFQFTTTAAVLRWTMGGADSYYYELSTQPGVSVIASGYTLSTSVSVSGIPLKGAPIYLRLWYSLRGTYQHLPMEIVYSTTGAAASQSAAEFVQLDPVTQGSWIGVYGGDGYNVFASSATNPSYVTPVPKGNSTYIWAASTADTRGLQQPGAPNQRIAGVWYAAESFSIDLPFNDGQRHTIAAYCLDWDRPGRLQTLQLLDTEGQVLDSRTVSNFGTGVWVVWKVTGHVVLNVKALTGLNAVLSGLFFGGDALPPVPVAVSVTPQTVNLSVNQTQQFTATVTNSSNTNVTWSLNRNLGNISSTGLYTAPASISTRQSVIVTATSNANGLTQASATVSLLPPPTPAGTTAQFVKVDKITQGSWKGKYGGGGYIVIGDAQRSPSYVTPTVAANSSYTWAGNTNDNRALQQVASETQRIAGVWYSPSSFTIDLPMADTETHEIAIYCLDWDNIGRSESIEVLDANGTVIDAQNVAGFGAGAWMVWNVSGHVQFRISRLNGLNAVATGVFFGGSGALPVTVRVSPTQTTLSAGSTQKFTATVTNASSTDVTWTLNPNVGTISTSGLYQAPNVITASQTVTVTATSAADHVTQSSAVVTLVSGAQVAATAQFVSIDPSGGNSGSIYGIEGYNVIGSAKVDPPYVVPVATANLTHVWALASDYGLSTPGTFGPAIAAAWYSATSFLVDLPFTDGKPHTFAVFCFDYDKLGRRETLEILDSNNATLDIRTISNFSQGNWVTWRVAGHVKLRVTKIAGPNAVISGLFFATPTLTPSINVTPKDVTLSSGQTKQFSAVESNVQYPPITWSIEPAAGSISTTGLYTAPAVITATQTVIVKALDTASGVQGQTTITLQPYGAEFRSTDYTTQGNWKGVYGGDGYDLIYASSYPAYVRPVSSGNKTYIWTNNTSDVRAPQSPTSSQRAAGVWYTQDELRVDLPFSDGQRHQLAVYLLDWDKLGRYELVEILGPDGLVLDRQDMSYMQFGVWLVWNVSGHVTLRIKYTGGLNAVVSGVFFGPPR